LLLTWLLSPSPGSALQTFRIHVDDQTEIVREVDSFEVVKVGEGYALLRLQPYQPDAAYTLLQLGKQTKLGETPLPGEAVWLAYVNRSSLVVARLPSNLDPEEVPVGTAVLSVRHDPKATAPVEGAIEAARALKALDQIDDARALLEDMVADPTQSASRCRLLNALLKYQLPEAPAQGEPIPPSAEKTLRSVLDDCAGSEGDAAAERFVQWTLDRLPQLGTSGSDLGAQKTIVRDALGMLSGHDGGDRLLLALANLHARDGSAEEGSRVLERFFREYPASAHIEEARTLQAELARRAPAHGYRSVGALGTGELTEQFPLREVTDLAFDARGRLVILDGRSKPRQILAFQLDPARRTLAVDETLSLSKEWDPIAVCAGDENTYYLIETDEDQVVAVGGDAAPAFPSRGDHWKLRSPRALCALDDHEVLVLDPSSERLHRFSVADRQYLGGLDLEANELDEVVDVASAPDGKVALATPEGFCLVTPGQKPEAFHRAMRGSTYRLAVGSVGMCRWRYVYLFDRESQRLEKFRRSGEWLTTVVDCEKEGIRDPALWAVSREGDVVVYDEKTDQLRYFAQ